MPADANLIQGDAVFGQAEIEILADWFDSRLSYADGSLRVAGNLMMVEWQFFMEDVLGMKEWVKKIVFELGWLILA